MGGGTKKKKIGKNIRTYRGVAEEEGEEGAGRV